MIFMNKQHPTLNLQRGPRAWPAWSCALGLFTAGMVMAISPSGAQQTNSDSGPSFNSFRIITQRNIFDPNRFADTGNNRQPTNRPRPVDAFGLVGTMRYSKGQFAFFDGTGPNYRKVLEPGGSVAGYTVKDITQTNVTLVANGTNYDMKVGAQMRKEEGSGWKLSDVEEPVALAADSSSNATDASAPTASPELENNPVLKRLMQLKQQESESK